MEAQDKTKKLMFEKDIGWRISGVRNDRSESQEELAAAIGVSRDVLAKWETGERHIKAEHIYKIAKHYNVSADYLLGLSDIESPDADLRAICKYTGLSEKCIKNISRLIAERDEDGFYPAGFVDGDPCTPRKVLNLLFSEHIAFLFDSLVLFSTGINTFIQAPELTFREKIHISRSAPGHEKVHGLKTISSEDYAQLLTVWAKSEMQDILTTIENDFTGSVRTERIAKARTEMLKGGYR